MPFGLKNAGATYQQLVTKMFQEHLGKTMEVYIDDMPVKSQQAGDHIQHPSDTFQILRKFNMKLNPEKCAFGFSSGKFLGFIVSNSGIEVNPVQIKAIEEILDILQDQFKWLEKFQQALKNLKVYLSNPSLLAKPKDGEKLLIYLVAEVAELWILFTDGSSNVKGEGLGIVLVPPTGETIRQAIKCHPVNNNEAEYEAMTAAREARMQQYLEKLCDIVRQFQTWKVVQIPREENVKADVLANLASAAEVTNDKNAYVIHLFHSVLDQDKNEYGIVPEDKKQAQALCKNTAWITSTPYHPVGNGQAESTNVIINNLKKILEESKGNWPEVLPGVLWAYRTTTKISTGETPFSLVYGAEALIPVEIGEPSTRYTQATEESNEEEMRVNIDLLEERREAALIRMATQKQVIERYYNRKARL
ncbi:uncharacterized protein [Nicotiana sylvestris]|uniref:uncharacterized protein n=1 Tax=Nicotiana sylvestris TaxID=4096 RepID=UPI00388C958C